MTVATRITHPFSSVQYKHKRINQVRMISLKEDLETTSLVLKFGSFTTSVLQLLLVETCDPAHKWQVHYCVTSKQLRTGGWEAWRERNRAQRERDTWEPDSLGYHPSLGLYRLCEFGQHLPEPQLFICKMRKIIPSSHCEELR